MKEQITLVEILMTSILLTIFCLCGYALWNESKQLKKYEASTRNYSNSVSDLLPVGSVLSEEKSSQR